MKDYIIPPRIKGPLEAHEILGDRLKRWALLDMSGTGTGKEVIACDIRNEGTAHRLAACWNACDGVSTEVLELNTQGGGVLNLERQRDAAKAQRDALLAALEEARAFIGEQQPRTEKVGDRVHLREDLSRVMRVMGQMDAAIAAAKAGTV